MRILLISSAFSGLTQRFFTELEDAGFTVSVELHLGDVDRLLEGVALFKPDVIVCPFLTRRIPQSIYENYHCLIVHPGIKGDRGPSSLDWAIQEQNTEWGVTLMAAQEEMDAGDIWASKTFPMRNATKSSLFYREVTQAAVDCLWEALTYINSPNFKPEPLDYTKSSIKGQLRPLMKQPDRAIDWKKHSTHEILTHIWAADGSPGVLDIIDGKPYYLFNAFAEPTLKGKAGEFIAMTDHAVCRATIDGALWIGHLQPQLESGSKGIKLPSTVILKDLLHKKTPGLLGLTSKSIKHLAIDYTAPNRQVPCQEVWYELEQDVAYLYFPFHNGGMSTQQCQLLLKVYQHIATLSVNVIVLMGGEEFWSNGIHLNHIEAAENPAEESWLNINAIDDLIYQIITTLDKVTIAAVAGNAGAGGAILALAADWVFAREGVVFNPHYKNMGELYGSEYWTYLLPKRVGHELATSLTELRLPISAKKAWRIGMIDKMLDKQHKIFVAQVKHLAKAMSSDVENLHKQLNTKAKTRCLDEAIKPLAAYRQFELTQMYANFYGNEEYHLARKRFVFKQSGEQVTPSNIAIHRQLPEEMGKLTSGSMYHFVWDDIYKLGDTLIDSEHRDLFNLANQLVSSGSQNELIANIDLLFEHVKEHFDAEESLMQKLNYHDAKNHINEHRSMLEKLTSIQNKINQQDWKPNDIQVFIDRWGKHILYTDMPLNDYLKEPKFESIA